MVRNYRSLNIGSFLLESVLNLTTSDITIQIIDSATNHIDYALNLLKFYEKRGFCFLMSEPFDKVYPNRANYANFQLKVITLIRKGIIFTNEKI